MKTSLLKIRNRRWEEGKAGYILLWLLGIPLPVLLVIYLLKGGS